MYLRWGIRLADDHKVRAIVSGGALLHVLQDTMHVYLAQFWLV